MRRRPVKLHTVGFLALIAAASLCGLTPGQAAAQICASTSPAIGWAGSGVNFDRPPVGCGFRCYTPTVGGVSYSVLPPGCDPWAGTCGLAAEVPSTFPGNHQNPYFGSSWVRLDWFRSNGSLLGSCGYAGTNLSDDDGIASINSGFACSDPNSVSYADTYTYKVNVCPGATGCPQPTATVSVPLTWLAAFNALCRRPPLDGCGEGSAEPGECCLGPQGASPPTGGPPGFGVPGTKAKLSYQGGGVGNGNFPGSVVWRIALGRGWSHEFAERIVLDPVVGNDTVVWYLTRWATFRRFSGLSGGVYTTARPSDEKRMLRRTASGWQLEELDGTIRLFDNAGLWQSTTPRNGVGPGWTAHYNASSQLDQVTFPDNRYESFSYYGNGKLFQVIQHGAGSAHRDWTYTWNGDQLTDLLLPDGRHWIFEYTDPTDLYLVTKMKLRGTDGQERVEAAWEYDSYGNVTKTWKGAANFADTAPAPVEKWTFGYDNAVEPSVTTATPPLGAQVTYTYDRDFGGGGKTRMLSVEGDCPVCGTSSPDIKFDYDPEPNANRLRPYRIEGGRILNGQRVFTDFTYTAKGLVATKIEAANNPESDPTLPKVTSYTYNATFPGLVTGIDGPAKQGVTPTRHVTLTYNSSTADLESRIEDGAEATYPLGTFSLTTTYTPRNTAGQPLTIDGPASGPGDQTTFTYGVAGVNGLLPDTRTDPLGLVTAFGYDSFNRRSVVTDPAGLVATTAFDDADRVTSVTRQALDALGTFQTYVTRNFYNPFGDIACVVYPRGNAVEYLYLEDLGGGVTRLAGRLVEIRRGTAVASPSGTSCLDTSLARERMIFAYDAVGHRTNEKRELWNGSAWVAQAETSYTYSSRCHLDSMTKAPGSGLGFTEYGYDCGGNMEKIWEPDRPTATFGSSASFTYSYDALNRLKTTSQPWGPGPPGTNIVTSFVYDSQDHLTSVTDAEGNVSTYVTSDRDLLTSERLGSAELGPGTPNTTTYRYDDHGERVEQTDARGVVLARTVDDSRRLRAENYPGALLDTTYSYDSAGRLSRIERAGAGLSFAHDGFGQRTRDGELVLGYDANGNRASVTYPGGLVATYDFDFADREASLAIQESGGSAQTIVSAPPAPPTGPLSEYAAFGPLTGVSLLGNMSEKRAFDARYLIDRITLQGGSGTLFDWDYTLSSVGDVTAIDDLGTSNQDRSFSYQDVQHFLKCAAGPWSPGAACNPLSSQPLQWSYDRIGNRLTEQRGAQTETSCYDPNGAGGNKALLDKTTTSTCGSPLRDYTFDAGGFLDSVNASGNLVDFSFDEAGKLARAERPVASEHADMRYDGRGLLAAVGPTLPLLADDLEAGALGCWSAAAGGSVNGACSDWPIFAGTSHAVYGSEGRLFALRRQPTGADAPLETNNVLYFAGRPMGLWRKVGTGTATLTYLTTDHLGTPVYAINSGGIDLVWSGGFEPFGKDWQYGQGATHDASESGVFLRLPGQWIDSAWVSATLGIELYQNLYRWIEDQSGRYVSSDRFIPISSREPSPFRYASADPLRFSDPLGLFSFDDDSCKCIPGAPDPREAAQQGCAYSRKPKCQQFMAAHTVTPWGPATPPGGGGSRENLLGCYSRLCDPSKEGSGPTVRCVRTPESCGRTPEQVGGINLHVPGAAICPRVSEGGPRNWGQTFFHELGHNCGVEPGDDERQWWGDIKKVCTGSEQ